MKQDYLIHVVFVIRSKLKFTRKIHINDTLKVFIHLSVIW